MMTRQQIIKLYGNPADRLGRLNQAWAHANLVSLLLPYPMRAAWDTEIVVKSVTVHCRVAQSLYDVLEALWNYARIEIKRQHGYGLSTVEYDRLTMDAIRNAGLDLFGGAWNYRKMRGGNQLSTHAFGIAIDIDPKHNALGTLGAIGKAIDTPANKRNLSDRLRAKLVSEFEARCWVWGGRFKRRDPMHFERTG